MRPSKPRHRAIKFGFITAVLLVATTSLLWMIHGKRVSLRAQAAERTTTAHELQGSQSEASQASNLKNHPSSSGATAAVGTAVQNLIPQANATPPPLASSTSVSSDGDEVEIDYSTHYVLINGHRAHPVHMLAKFKTKESVQSRETLLAQFELRAKNAFPLTPDLVILKPKNVALSPVASEQEARARGERMLERIKELLKTGQFEYVEPDYIRTIDTTPSDSAFTDGSLWGLHNIGQSGGVVGADIDAARAWDITTGSVDVVVAVIDTGIRYTHQDLSTQMWRNPGEVAGNGVDDDHDGYVDNVYGINAITNSGDPMDTVGHGTHVAGTIGAAANAGGQHVGVAWQVRLMACRFLGSSGGSDSDAIKCINFAVSKGVRILSNSWGGDGYSQSLYDAIATARNNGVLFVAAAGNSGRNTDTNPEYPAAFDLSNIISVAALDRQDKLAYFSNYGATSVDIGAPGVSIFSCYNSSDTSYNTLQGTSMATPHVSGVAALVLSNSLGLSMTELRQRILDAAIPIPALTGKAVTGGRLNAFNALTGEPDGILEVSMNPVSGTELMGGTTIPFFVTVRDYTAVQNATVTGTITGNPTIAFRNDGVAPDVTANDNIYSASIPLSVSAPALSLQIDVSAPDKTSKTNNYTYPVRLPPTNDNFAARTALTSDTNTIQISNVGATKEAGEPNHAGSSGGRSIWWTWTATASGTMTLSTDGTNFDTVLGVYTGSAVNNLTVVASDDESGVGNASLVAFAATSGTTYQIAVDGFGGASGNITLNTSFVAAPQPPANDNFANASVLSGSNPTATGTNQAATKETSEPNHADNAGGHSVWWSWTAPSTGTATVTTDGSLFDTTLAVYVGTSLSSLAPIASDNDSGEGSRSQVNFNAIAGTTYKIAVDGYNNSIGTIALSVSLVISPPVPANDNFANASSLTGTTASAAGTNVGATKETDEPDHAQNSGGKSVWWTWTAPNTGTVTITTTGSAFDTLLAVYTGSSVGGLATVASNDQDPLGGNTSRIIFNTTTGTTYKIAVDGVNNGLNIAIGNISLNLTLSTQTLPTNDFFAYRTAITGSSATVTGTNVGATKEAGEPNHYSSSATTSVWWSWTAASTGNAIITTEGSSFDTVLAIYTGTAVNNLTSVASDDDNGPGSTSLVSFSATAGTTYQIAVAGWSGSGGNITLKVNPSIPPPVITSQPTSTSRYVTDTIGLTVVASSTNPMTYQWKKDGVNLADGSHVSGATSPYLLIYDAIVSDTGQYTAVVSNSSGSTTSNPASLTVTLPPAPVVTTHPSNANLYVGGYFQINVGVTSYGTTRYQWQKSTDGGVTFANITGATSSYYYKYSIQTGDTGQYRVVITNPGGSTTSDPATITVSNPTIPVITTHPASQNLYLSQTLNLSATATGGGSMTYQWQKSTNGGVTFTNISSAMSSYYSIYSVQAADAGQYRVIVTNAGGSTTSNVATIAVAAPPAPVITTQPSSQNIYLGSSFNLSVSITNVGTATYQWQKSTDGGATFANISYATSSSYYISNAQALHAGQYRVIITNAGGSITSNAATIAFVTPPPPVINSHPTDTSAYTGAAFSFSVATSITGTTTYQWQFSLDGGVTFANISGATSSYYSVSPSQASHAGKYRVVVTNPGGSTTSNAATLALLTPPAPTISTQPIPTTVTAGSSFYMYGYATGSGSITYQWQKDGVNLVNDSNRIYGATSSNLTIYSSTLADSGQYRFVATNVGGSATSNAVAVTVNPPPSPVISTHPTNMTAIVGDYVSLSVYATGSGLTYQWQKNGVNLTNGSRISGATSRYLYINSLQSSDAGEYRVVVTNTGGSTTSNAATLTVNRPPPPTITTSPTNVTVTVGSSFYLYVYASGTGPLTYKWQKDGVDIINGGRISGANTYSLSVSSAQTSDAGIYRAIVSNDYGSVTSQGATVAVYQPTAPTFIIHPQPQYTYTGAVVTFTAVATGNPAPTYDWYINNNRLGSSSSSITLSASSPATNTITVKAINVAGTATSNPAAFEIYAPESGHALGIRPATRTVGCGRVVYPISVRGTTDWTVTKSANWLSVSATSGAYEKILLVTVAPNQLPTNRSATITIGQSTHIVTQRATGTPIRELWAMGANDLGQLADYSPPAILYPGQVDTSVKAIAAGAAHTLYIKTDGTLWACGENGSGQHGIGSTVDQFVPVQVAINVSAVACGADHTVFLKTDGTLWACGGNSYQQLGDGTSNQRSAPVQIASSVGAVACGSNHTVFLKTDGTLWACGSNSYGQLGTGGANASTPTQVTTGVQSVAAGGNHTMFVKTDGTLWATGYNYNGQLGNGTTTNRTTPVQVATGVQSVTCGRNFTHFIKTDGTLWSMGDNGYGQLGSSSSSRSTPSQVTTSVQSVAAGAEHTLYIKTDGSLWACGNNAYRSLGDGSNSSRYTPIKIGNAMQKCAAGSHHSLFLKTDGTLYAVGDNSSGQLGNALAQFNIRGTPVSIDSDAISASGGDNHTIFVRSDGTAWTAGSNGYGQLGDTSTTSRSQPAQIATGIASSASGYNFSLLLKTDGTLLGSGYNYDGELGNGTASSRSIFNAITTGVGSVKAGGYHSLWKKTDGTLWACGQNTYGQLGDGSVTNRMSPVQIMANIQAVATGTQHTLFLKTDATLWAAGYNYYGQLGDGTTTTRQIAAQILGSFKAAAGGEYHSLLLKSDNSAWASGNNTYGQLGDGTTTQRLTPVQIATNIQTVATGQYHSLLLKNDNTLWAVGDNSSGQLGDGTFINRTTPVAVAANVQSIASGGAHTLFTANGDIRLTRGAAPTIASFSPTVLANGATVTITGTNFTNVGAVYFAGTEGSFTVNSSTQITATAPNGVIPGGIIVNTFEGAGMSAINYTVNNPPPAPSSSSGGGGGAPSLWFFAALGAAGFVRRLSLQARRR